MWQAHPLLLVLHGGGPRCLFGLSSVRPLGIINDNFPAPSSHCSTRDYTGECYASKRAGTNVGGSKHDPLQ